MKCVYYVQACRESRTTPPCGHSYHLCSVEDLVRHLRHRPLHAHQGTRFRRLVALDHQPPLSIMPGLPLPRLSMVEYVRQHSAQHLWQRSAD